MPSPSATGLTPRTSDGIQLSQRRTPRQPRKLPRITGPWTLLGHDLRAQLRNRQTKGALLALAVLPAVFTVALIATGAARAETVQNEVLVPSSSGITIWVLALASTMKFFLPLAIAVFAGNAIASEAASGNLRYILASPRRRSSVFFQRVVVAGVLSILGICALCAGALLAGVISFGWHPLTIMLASKSFASSGPLGGLAATRGATSILSPIAATWRLVWSTSYVACGMATIFAFGLLLSVLFSRPFIAISGAVGLAVVSWSLQSDMAPELSRVSAFMPLHGIGKWQYLLLSHPEAAGTEAFVLKQVAYVSVFLLLAWWSFARKDVLS
ncbi:MAG: ABC transporter permease [Acidimicrobiales bacterium]